jgi:hypothetical protein
MSNSTTLNPSTPSPSDPSDPFDTLLTLEDTLYTTAYTLGASDGAHAGRIEGRIFGLEKGFEKFAALGALHGRAAVWSGQISPPSKPSLRGSGTGVEERSEEAEMERVIAEKSPEGGGNLESVAKSEGSEDSKGFPKLDVSAKTRTHIEMLHALSDPATFSTLNTEEAVADYDDRVKRAAAKAKIIERIVSTAPSAAKRTGDGAKGKGDDNMEDFTGSRLLR